MLATPASSPAILSFRSKLPFPNSSLTIHLPTATPDEARRLPQEATRDDLPQHGGQPVQLWYLGSLTRVELNLSGARSRKLLRRRPPRETACKILAIPASRN